MLAGNLNLQIGEFHHRQLSTHFANLNTSQSCFIMIKMRISTHSGDRPDFRTQYFLMCAQSENSHWAITAKLKNLSQFFQNRLIYNCVSHSRRRFGKAILQTFNTIYLLGNYRCWCDGPPEEIELQGQRVMLFKNFSELKPVNIDGELKKALESKMRLKNNCCVSGYHGPQTTPTSYI